MIIRLITITCDACYAEHDAAEPFVRDVKRAAQADGWSVYGKRHLCPECRSSPDPSSPR